MFLFLLPPSLMDPHSLWHQGQVYSILVHVPFLLPPTTTTTTYRFLLLLPSSHPNFPPASPLPVPACSPLFLPVFAFRVFFLFWFSLPYLILSPLLSPHPLAAAKVSLFSQRLRQTTPFFPNIYCTRTKAKAYLNCIHLYSCFLLKLSFLMSFFCFKKLKMSYLLSLFPLFSSPFFIFHLVIILKNVSF